jgi:hypothetical protein
VNIKGDSSDELFQQFRVKPLKRLTLHALLVTTSLKRGANETQTKPPPGKFFVADA